MKHFSVFFVIMAALLTFFGCRKAPQAPLSLHWEFSRNDVEPRQSEAFLTVTNNTSADLDSDWKLYFCLESMIPIHNPQAAVSGKQIQGSYHFLAPAALYEPIPAGESRTYTLRFRGTAIRESIRPEGFFLVKTDNGNPVTIPCTYAKYTRKEQMLRGIDYWEKTPYADGEYVYQYNDRCLNENLSSEAVLPLLPQPKQVEYASDGQTVNIKNSSIQEITDAAIPDEGYRINLTQEQITIYASTAAGFYYAHNTLSQLGSTTDISSIYDYPDMPHRGVMLDIVRNFYPLDSMLRVLDVMADLKLNVLHFHLADDEAWRVEIPGLPQLTKQGARRGYTLTEKECLYPMYMGGWDYTDPTNTGNGYYTRADYIRLLRYAKERQIRVIPEVDMPGHMRACKKALYPLLTDSLMEQRQYVSAQEYTDNVIAVTNPYALVFIETVVTELKKMYQEAGCPFTQFHIGGDEVPEGALTKEEHQAFIDGVMQILAKNGLQAIGWEEITHFCAPETKAVCYSWHNGEQKPMEMAQAGYPVVLATANHLYFDFAYCRHQEEKGLDWGGYTDEFRSFDWEPVQHPNIIGMNAQLWAECLRDFAQVEWQLFPKMYGLSERAWNNRSKLSLSNYTHIVYDCLLPELHQQKHNFHLQQPGIKPIRTDEGIRLIMNKVMTGGEILYTTDDCTWHKYESDNDKSPVLLPADFKGVVKAKIHYLDHESNTTWLWID